MLGRAAQARQACKMRVFTYLSRDKHVTPRHIEDRMKQIGANYVQTGLWRGFAGRDGNPIIGQKNFSGTETTAKVIGRPLARRFCRGCCGGISEKNAGNQRGILGITLHRVWRRKDSRPALEGVEKFFCLRPLAENLLQLGSDSIEAAKQAGVRCEVRSSARYAWPFRTGEQCSRWATRRSVGKPTEFRQLFARDKKMLRGEL